MLRVKPLSRFWILDRDRSTRTCCYLLKPKFRQTCVVCVCVLFKICFLFEQHNEVHKQRSAVPSLEELQHSLCLYCMQ